MNEPIRIKECETHKILLSEIPSMILPERSQIKFPEQTKFIIKSLIDDILFTRKDREVEVEFFFGTREMTVTLDFGYIHLRKGTELSFKNEYDFDVFTNVDKIISESIEREMAENYAHFSEIDLEKANKFFEHIKILDEALNFNGRLLAYTKKTEFKSNVYELKDSFEGFDITKTVTKSMCIKLKNDTFDVSSYHEEIIFNFNGIRLMFRPDQMKDTYKIVSTIQALIGVLQ